MANKRMKRCSTSWVIREMQIKTTEMPLHTIRMAKTQNTDIKHWWECEATGTLIHCWWKCKMARPLWKTVWQFLTKLNIFSPCDLAIVILGIYPKALKTYVHTKICVGIFVTLLFTIAKVRKKPKCSSLGNGHPYNGILFSQNEVSYQAKKRMEET